MSALRRSRGRAPAFWLGGLALGMGAALLSPAPLGERRALAGKEVVLEPAHPSSKILPPWSARCATSSGAP